MRWQRRLMAILLACAVFGGCKKEEAPRCPTCADDEWCNVATGTCVPAEEQCSATGCGPNGTCRSDGVCTCNAGFADCNKDLGSAGTNGCECSGGCSGTGCSASASCSAQTAGSCGGESSYCDGTRCNPCAAGTFNCDRLGSCESATTCGSSDCRPTAANACGKTQYCSSTNQCVPCPAGKYNCDGLGDCESSTACTCSPTTPNACGGAGQYCLSGACAACPQGAFNCDGLNECESCTACGGPAPTGCDKSCTDWDPSSCVKDPANSCRCEDCLTSAHCTGNPDSKGPVCDTSDLAGTGFSFCICASAADCAASTQGKLCKAAPGANPKLTQCTCDTDADCPATNPICEGSLFKKCRPRCHGPEGCVNHGVQGVCDTATGRCSYPDA